MKTSDFIRLISEDATIQIKDDYFNLLELRRKYNEWETVYGLYEAFDYEDFDRPIESIENPAINVYVLTLNYC